MPTANGFTHSVESWQSLSGLWDRAGLMRAFLWHQQYLDVRALLIQFLVRLRRFYGVDFCSGGLLDGEQLTVAAVPEAGLDQLPGNFARRCLDLVAHARAPITWNEVKAEFGLRSMVVAPIAPPSGVLVGFLMLGHSSRRVYSAAELFVLQTLADELSWVAREMNGKKAHRAEVADLSHDVKNTLQLIVGYTALIRQNLTGVLGGEQERFFSNIESDVEKILEQLSRLPAVLGADDHTFNPPSAATVNIAAALEEAIAASQSVGRERGVEVEVVYGPKTPEQVTINPAILKRILQALVYHAVVATHDDKVKFSLRHDGSRLEIAVKGNAKNRLAENLESRLESAAQATEVDDESGDQLVLLREFLQPIGGEVCLKSRPGESSEFIVRLPAMSNAESKRSVDG